MNSNPISSLSLSKPMPINITGPGQICPKCTTRMERYSITDPDNLDRRLGQTQDGRRLKSIHPIHDSCPKCGFIIMDRTPDQDQAPSGILMRLRFSDIPLVLLIALQIWMATTRMSLNPNLELYGAIITIIYAVAWLVWRMTEKSP